MSPPLGLIGSAPPISISPFSMAFHDSPGPVSPMWSMARYSLGVKQSCTSKPSTSSSVTRRGRTRRAPHRGHAATHTGRRRSGRASAAGPVRRCDAPSRRSGRSGARRGGRAGSRRSTRTTPAPPSVIWLQSKRRSLPSTTGLTSSSSASRPARRSGTVQPRVCALGFDRALAKFSCAIARRWLSSRPYRLSYSSATRANMLRPHERGVGALVADPGRRAEVLGGGVARHRLLQLDADDQRGLGRRRTADRRSRPGSRRCRTRRRPHGVTTGCPTALRARSRASRRGGPAARTAHRTRWRRARRRSRRRPTPAAARV